MSRNMMFVLMYHRHKLLDPKQYLNQVAVTSLKFISHSTI
jgi:hypothetical protein